MNTSTTATATSIKVFTHQDVPNSDALVAQASELAASHGLGIELIAVDADVSQAMAVGVMGLPAIIIFGGNTEISRRECAFAGRRTSRWFKRQVASTSIGSTLIPAIA